MRTVENLPRHELIGLYVEISNSRDPNKIGINGKVIDEGKNILKLESGEKEIKIPKKECEFTFTLPNGKKVIINGKLLVGRPEERIKKRLPEKWGYLND